MEGRRGAETASKAGGLEMISLVLIMQNCNGLMIFFLYMARNLYISLLMLFMHITTTHFPSDTQIPIIRRPSCLFCLQHIHEKCVWMIA